MYILETTPGKADPGPESEGKVEPERVSEPKLPENKGAASLLLGSGRSVLVATPPTATPTSIPSPARVGAMIAKFKSLSEGKDHAVSDDHMLMILHSSAVDDRDVAINLGTGKLYWLEEL
jgi:hypothetical protein